MTPMEKMQQISPISLAVIAELRRIGEQYSCILAGATLTKVLHKMGFTRAYPITIRAFIFNAQLYQWAKSNTFSNDPAVEREWTSLGGKMIGLGAGIQEVVPAGKWLGHLAVIIPNHFDDRHAMFDLTIPQAHKPEWGINLPPVIVRVHDAFVKGKREFKTEANNCLIIYKAFPDDREYTGFNVWKDASLSDAIAERVLSGLPK